VVIQSVARRVQVSNLALRPLTKFAFPPPSVYTHVMSSNFSQVISFRVDDTLARRLAALRSTFPNQQWGEVMRWLLTNQDISDVIDSRLQDSKP